MSDFKDFVKKHDGMMPPPQLGHESSAVKPFNVTNLSSAVLSVFRSAQLLDVENKKQQELSEHVAEVVASDTFIEELSTTLGDPMPEESENEFVARARMAFRGLMSKKLSKF